MAPYLVVCDWGLQIIGRGVNSKSRESGNLCLQQRAASHIRGRWSKCYVVGVLKQQLDRAVDHDLNRDREQTDKGKR